ncbi:MAG TPA: D-2-hydroxyacid dehydrogenase [Vicinamibacterales bacterium]|nr:D-2-hydroxyacid dehydrogenase [Vicinamibacterales bacterium]
MRVVVAVHDPPVWTMPAEQVARIASRLPDDDVVGALEPDERRREFPMAEVIVTTRLKGDEFALARRLRWIHTTAVGVGPLLSREAVASDVVITNARGSHSEAIAEHAIALVLALRRHLHIAAARQAAREWAQIELQARRVATLPHSRLLVVGLGSIGSRVAALGRGLGMHVTGVRRRLDQPVPDGVSEVVAPEQLREALGRADAVVLAVPRTSETRALIGEPEFEAMRPSAVLVNIARGRLIDDAALLRAVESGRIAGAGLDAFQEEPLPPSHPLWTAPNVLITPHTAAFAGDYWPPVVEQFLENMRLYKKGEPLINVVDKKAGY